MTSYQFLPPLSDAEYEALRADIAANGMRHPILVDEKGKILDGHHRARIAAELDFKPEREVLAGLTEAEKRDVAFTLNAARRHMDTAAKRAAVIASLKADPQLSDRQHARRCGSSHPTVAGIRAELAARGQVESFTTSTGADGKTYTRPISPPAGPTALSDSATEADQPGSEPPAATGEALAGLDAAVPAAEVKAPSSLGIGVPALDGAGVDATGSDLGPVETAEAAWPRVVTPAASGGGTDAAGDTPEDDRGLAGAIADAQREARTAPAHLAHKAFETLKVFRDHVTRNCGGVDAICDDLTGVDATTRRQIWLAELDDTAELINAWRDRLRRQYLRRIQ